MNIKKLIRESIKEVLNENYPAGAENDSRAPWLQSEPKYTTPESPSVKEFSVIGVFPNEIAILQDALGKKYSFYFNHLSKTEFEPYAQREIVHSQKGWEDGEVDHDYSEDWSIDSHVIENYVNDNSTHMTRGVGMQALEGGVDIVTIDDALKAELLRLYGKDPSIQKALV